MGRYDLVKLVCITGLKIDESYADLNNTLGLVHLKQDVAERRRRLLQRLRLSQTIRRHGSIWARNCV